LSTITQESSNYEFGVGKSSAGKPVFEEGAETEEDLQESVAESTGPLTARGEV